MTRKGKGIFEFSEELDRALLCAYRRVVSTYPYEIKGMRHIAHLIKGESAPRFFVSPERARQVMYMMKRGKLPSKTLKERRKMYDEIGRRVTMMQSCHPEKSFTKIVELIVENPAPSFYMTEQSILKRLYRIIHHNVYRNQQRNK